LVWNVQAEESRMTTSTSRCSVQDRMLPTNM
jgi:hypothetical protein